MNNPFESIDARLSNIENLLLDIKHSKPEAVPTSQPTDKFLTVPEAAIFLSVSITTIYGWSHQKNFPFPFFKRGKRIYFSQKDLAEYIRSGKKKTAEELEADAKEFLNQRKNK